MINPGRFMNLPAAVVAIVIRKLFDACAGGEIAELVRPVGLGTAEYLRDYVQNHIQSGVSIYIIGAAVTTVTYYLKNCKIIRVIKRGFLSDRSRDTIACMTTKSIFKRSGLNRSLRLLFRREDKRRLDNLQRGTFPKSRPSTTALIQTRSSANRRQQSTGTPNTNSVPLLQKQIQTMPNGPPQQIDSYPVSMISVTSIESRPSTVSTGTSTTAEANFSFAYPQPRKKTSTKHRMTMTQDDPSPKGPMTHLQDVYGNIYERHQMGLSQSEEHGRKRMIEDAGGETDDQMSQSPPDSFRAFETDNCDGDYTRPAATDDDAFTPNMLNELLPAEDDVMFYKDANVAGKTGRGRGTQRSPPRRVRSKEKAQVPRTKKRAGVPRSRNRGRRAARSRLMGEGLRSAASLTHKEES